MLQTHSKQGYLIGDTLRPRPTTGRQYTFESALSRAIDSLQGVGSYSESQIRLTIARGIAEALGAGRAMIYMLDDSGKIEACEGYRMNRDESHNTGKFPTEMMKIAVDQKIPIYIPDVTDKRSTHLNFKGEPLLNPEIVKRNIDKFGKNFKTKREKMDLAVVPLIVGEKVIGLIRVDSWNHGRSVLRKSMDPVSLLATIQIFAFFAAQAIQTVRLVTQLKHDRESARRTNIETRTYTETLIHDIKNMLTGPVGWVNLLTSGKAMPPEVRDNAIMRVRDGLKKTLTFTQSTLDGIRSRGKLSLGNIEMALFELHDLIVFEAKDFGKIKFELESIQLRSDQRRVAIVLRELLANARKYSTPDSEIIVKTEIIDKESAGKYVKISVTDKGEGFEKEDQEKIFQGERVTKSVADGWGMGLKNIRTLVILLGGHISAESAGSGKGSTFWFTLPLSSEA